MIKATLQNHRQNTENTAIRYLEIDLDQEEALLSCEKVRMDSLVSCQAAQDKSIDS